MRPALRGDRRRVAGGRRGGADQPAPRSRPGVLGDDDRRLPALISPFLEPEFGPMVAEEIGEVEWQMWVDQLSSEGLSRSRIASHVAVASAIYAWALTPSRRFVTRNPLRLVELPPNDEKPRMRVAFAEEAAQLLAVLEPEDQVPYALALLLGAAALGDRPARVDRGPRRRPDRRSRARDAREERGGHRAPPADRRAAALGAHRDVAPAGPPGARAGARAVRDVGQDRRAREQGLGRRRPHPDHAA